MQVKPVKNGTTPRYPTRDYLNDHPELLYLVPERWRHNRLVLAVLGGVLSLSLASQSQAAGQPGASRIAPIFVHGNGRAAFGCMAVNPPVFLTEDEAAQVIRGEAKRAGLKFAPAALTITKAVLPATDRFAICGPIGDEKRRERKPATQTRDLTLDGYDRKRNVAYEFVSLKRFEEWEKRERRVSFSVSSDDLKERVAVDLEVTPLCSVSEYDLKGTAERARTGLITNQPQAWVGVFYEPAAGWGLQKVGRRRAEEELRKQVRDFLQWLKAQGVI